MATDLWKRGFRAGAVAAAGRTLLADRPLALDRRGAGLVRLADPGAERGARAAGLCRRLAAVFRDAGDARGSPGVRADAGHHRAGHGGQHGLRDGPGAGAGPAAVLGAGAPGRRRRLAVRRLAGGGRLDADRAVRAGGLAGPRPGVERVSGDLRGSRHDPGDPVRDGPVRGPRAGADPARAGRGAASRRPTRWGPGAGGRSGA